MSPRKKNALRVALGLVVGLALTEIAFRVRDHGAFAHLNVYVADAELGVRLAPGTTEEIRFGSEKNPVTSVRIGPDGFRAGGEEKEELLVIGDSQVFGLGVDADQTFASALHAKNLGVPTYGPAEYNAVLAAALATHHPKTVVWVVNMANDLFEATRANKSRHAVWDGWAVRKETAPQHVTDFPGRSLLFTHSHAVLALRRWMHGTEPDEAGFASEGTWTDVGVAAKTAETEHDKAARENEDRENARSAAIGQAEKAAREADQTWDSVVESKFYGELDKDGANGDLPKLRLVQAARLSPGDIVSEDLGEGSRGVAVTADQIRRGAALRRQLEARALADKSDKFVSDTFAKREAAHQKAFDAKEAPPPETIVPYSPLTPALRAAKALCDKAGARLFVAALPIDVQVSKDEWTKYGATPIDMEATHILNDDVIVAARSLDADGIDLLPALRAAEPGAFLDKDIHLTPKGHRTVADAIAAALAKPREKKVVLPGLGMPEGRSAPPRADEWTAKTEIAAAESDPAGCETKVVREWLGVFCRNKGGATGVKVDRGFEVMAGALPGEAVLVAPMVEGQSVHAFFSFANGSRELTATPDGKVPIVAFTKPLPARSDIPGPPPESSAFCTCHKSCATAASSADADCVRTYAADCVKMLACSAGDPSALPTCPEGQAPAGAAHRCRPLCADAPCASGTCTSWQGGRVCL